MYRASSNLYNVISELADCLGLRLGIEITSLLLILYYMHHLVDYCP
jgi:hypothetical protein